MKLYSFPIDNICRELTNTDKRIALCYAIIAALSTLAINHADSTIPEKQYLWISHGLMLLSLLYLWLLLIRTSVICWHKQLLIVFIVWYFFTTFHRYDTSSLNLGLFSAITIFTIAYLKKEILSKAFLYYRNYLVCMSLFGIVAYISMIFDIGLPRTVCPYYSERLGESYQYYDYYLSYIAIEGMFARLCGLFNEPGYYGTMLALCLIVDRLDLRKSYNIILFIAGLLTFSAAFSISIILYIAYICFVRRKYKIIVLLLLVVGIISQIQFENANVLRLLERLSFKDGKLEAINRTSDTFDVFFSNFIFTQESLFGYGSGYLSSMSIEGNLSYKNHIVEYGLLPCAIFWIGLLRKGIKDAHGNINIWAYTLIFMINVYQRPTIFVSGYMLLLFGGTYYLYFIQNENSN